jgi:hypothetical protein
MREAGRTATTAGVIASLVLALAALVTSVRNASYAEAAKPEVDSGIAARHRRVRSLCR